MADKTSINNPGSTLDIRIKIGGDRAVRLIKFIKAKQDAGHYRNMMDAAVAILLESEKASKDGRKASA